MIVGFIALKLANGKSYRGQKTCLKTVQSSFATGLKMLTWCDLDHVYLK